MSRPAVREELAREHLDLIKADRHIVEGWHRIDRQHVLIGRLIGQGHDTNQAETLLLNFEGMLDVWREHRLLIIDRIAVLENS